MVGVVLALVVAVMWGFWSICMDRAQSNSGPYGAAAVTAIVSTVLGLLALPVLLHLSSKAAEPSPLKGAVWASLGALLAASASLVFLWALRLGKPALVIPVSSTYPLITLLLLAAIGLEPTTGKQWLGTGLVVLGVVVSLIK